MIQDQLLFVADCANYNRDHVVADFLVKHLTERGDTVDENCNFAKRLEFVELEKCIQDLHYRDYAGFSECLDLFDKLHLKWNHLDVVQETWIDNRAKIILQRAMSFLSHCIKEEVHDNKLLSKVTLNKGFVGDDYLDSIDEIFSSKSEVELSVPLAKHEAKVMSSNLKKVCVITERVVEIPSKTNRRGKTNKPTTRADWDVDENKVIDLYHDFQLEDFKQNLIKYINSVEELALPIPVLSCRYSDEDEIVKQKPRKSLTGCSNWSESRRLSEGPYNINNNGNLHSVHEAFTRKNEALDPLVSIVSSPHAHKNAETKRARDESATQTVNDTEQASKKPRKLTSPSRTGVRLSPIPTQDSDFSSDLEAESNSATATNNNNVSVLDRIKAATAAATSSNTQPAISPLRKPITDSIANGQSNINADNYVPTASSGKGKKRIPWSMEEEEAFRQGISLYGKGAWAEILKDYTLHSVLFRRTNMQLKDKYANWVKKGEI